MKTRHERAHNVETNYLVAGLRNHQHNHIEVGSEILVPAAACLTDDNVRQKLDAGAILVHGKEELPYEEDNNRKRRPYSTGQINHERINNLENDEEHRRLSDDEVVRVRRTDGRRRLRSAGSDHEEYYTGRNKNKNDEQMRDKNANARITRGNLTTHRQSATLPRRRRRRALSGSFAGNPLPPHRVTPDGTAIYYWCELPRRPGSQGKFFFPLPDTSLHPITRPRVQDTGLLCERPLSFAEFTNYAELLRKYVDIIDRWE